MEIEKTITAVVTLIGALTGLITALVGLFQVIKKEKPQPDSAQVSGQATAPNARRKKNSSIFPKLMRSRIFTTGVILLIISILAIAYAIISSSLLSVEITNLVSEQRLNVKSDNNGSGYFLVEGTFTGDLIKDNLKIYVLVRSADALNAPWYLQSLTDPIKQSSWLSKGEWRLEDTSVGRGDVKNDLKRGEKWEIQSVIAINQEYPRNGIPPGELMSVLKPLAISQRVVVEVADIMH